MHAQHMLLAHKHIVQSKTAPNLALLLLQAHKTVAAMHTSNSCSCGHTLSGQVLGNNPVQFSYSTHNVGAVHDNEYGNIYHFIPFICCVYVCMHDSGWAWLLYW